MPLSVLEDAFRGGAVLARPSETLSIMVIDLFANGGSLIIITNEQLQSEGAVIAEE